MSRDGSKGFQKGFRAVLEVAGEWRESGGEVA